MYKLSSWLIVLAAAVGAYVGFSKLFPGETREEALPPEPETTGDEKIDALLAEGQRAVGEFRRLRASIPDKSVTDRIDTLTELTDKIFKDVAEDPADYPQVKRFANYYLPTTLKLLNAYDRMAAQDVAGENITDSMQRISGILDTTEEAYKKQLDALFSNQALDIETDITVLETMLKREGLSGGDFTAAQQ